MKFLDPTNDYAFKRIFGNENKKEILVSFLNSLLGLEGNKVIVDVDLLNPLQAPHISESKETILDIRCHDHRGTTYIVEMQVLKTAAFDKRVQYYASRAYSGQLETGSNYLDLSPVIFIGILNFEFTENHKYISTHLTQDVETGEHVLTDFEFHFVELPKFLKTEDELDNLTDKWIYFLKHASELKSVPEVIYEQALKEAFEIVNRGNWNRDELEYYDRHGMARINAEMQLLAAREDGAHEAERRIVRGMLEQGVDADTICKAIGLSRQELAEITGADCPSPIQG